MKPVEIVSIFWVALIGFVMFQKAHRVGNGDILEYREPRTPEEYYDERQFFSFPYDVVGTVKEDYYDITLNTEAVIRDWADDVGLTEQPDAAEDKP